MLVINLLGGPGSRKSTLAADVFARLKWANINCELVNEYAKDKVWEGSFKVLDNQPYIFAKQYTKLDRLRGQVNIVITDSPLLLSLIYNKKEGKEFEDFVKAKWDSFINLNFMINRKATYNPIGRTQTEEEAKHIDTQIKELMYKNKYSYFEIEGVPESAIHIANTVMDYWSKAKKRELDLQQNPYFEYINHN